MKNFVKTIKSTLNITYYSVRMFFRDKAAVWFSIFLPILIMSIFGVINLPRPHGASFLEDEAVRRNH